MTILWTDDLKPSASLFGRSFGVVALAALGLFFVRLYQTRTRFRAVMKQHDIVSTAFVRLGRIRLVAEYFRSASCLTLFFSDI